MRTRGTGRGQPGEKRDRGHWSGDTEERGNGKKKRWENRRREPEEEGRGTGEEERRREEPGRGGEPGEPGRGEPIPVEFGIAFEDLLWNHCASTLHRSETNGNADRAVRRATEMTSTIVVQSRLDEEWWAVSLECCGYSRKFKTSQRIGRLNMIRSLSTDC